MKIHNTVGMGMLIILASLIIATSPSAHATIITLTGGDPGEGYHPAGGPFVYAYDLHNTGSGFGGVPATNTIQGVQFVPFDNTAPPPGFTISGASGNFEGAPDIGATANDNALEFINDNDVFANPGTGPLTLTIGGLTALKSYQVDLFVRDNGGGRNENFTFNGAQLNSFIAGAGVYYDVRESVVSDGSGMITVALTSPTATFPFLNAFSVTEVPEPSTVML